MITQYSGKRLKGCTNDHCQVSAQSHERVRYRMEAGGNALDERGLQDYPQPINHSFTKPRLSSLPSCLLYTPTRALELRVSKIPNEGFGSALH